MPIPRQALVLLAALATVCGCTTPTLKGKSPLMPAQMSPDSVALDMFFVRFPFGDTDANEKLWQEIDEQRLPAELRERLRENGFRVGIVTGQIPSELSKLLALPEKPAPSDETEKTSIDSMESQPRVVRRHLQIRANQPNEIIASGVYAQLPLLTGGAGQISGQTYNEAQGYFSIKTNPRPDGQVRLELTPALHHGESRQRWISGQGMMRLETGQSKRTFDDMTIQTELPPGAMLVLSSLPNQRGSLGDYFFSESDNGRTEQKLLIVRLSQTQHNGLFGTLESMELDEEKGQ
jgi:hypothetical protein